MAQGHGVLGDLTAFLHVIISEVGKPYIYGDTGPKAFDCSGLVEYAARKAGWLNVPRTSEEQWTWCDHIQRNQLRPGDLVFTQWPGDNAPPGHVQVYAGDGNVIGADDQALGVAITPLSGNAGHIIGYGRLPNAQGNPGPVGTGGGGNGNQPSGFSWLESPLVTGLGFGWLGSGITGVTGTFSDIGDVAKAISGGVTELAKVIKWTSWLFEPANWLRIMAGITGVQLLVIATAFLIWAAM